MIYLIAMMAAMKKVLSPSSEMTMTEREAMKACPKLALSVRRRDEFLTLSKLDEASSVA